MVSVRSKRVVAGLAGAAALATGGGVAFAEQQGTSGEAPARQAFVADVASQLGISADDVEQAFEAAALERVDAARASGRLTDAQADRLRERIRAGEGAPRRLYRPRPLARAIRASSEYLDLSAREIAGELRAGKSLAQIAQDHGKTGDGLVQALLDAASKRLDAGVEAGRWTQAEANQLLSGLRQILPVIVDHAPAARS
jgi:hypothetical protein